MLGFGATGQFAIGEVGITGTGAETITPDKWYQALSEPVRFKPGVKASAQQFTAFFPNPLVSFGWFEGLSEPVRFKPGLSARLQQALAFYPQPFVSFGWFAELSKPQSLTKRGLLPGQQQFLALQPAPSPFVATGWFSPLSEPVRLKPGLRSSLQQSFTFNALPFVSFGWFGALSEPVRLKPGLKASLQQFFTTDTTVIPTSKLIQWFAALSEPVRFKPGLRAPLQQFMAWPPQLRPTATTTAVLDATETKDTFLGAAQSWNRVISGEIGVIEKSFTGAEIGVLEQPYNPGGSGIVMEITSTVSGAAVPVVARGSVSIRVV